MATAVKEAREVTAADAAVQAAEALEDAVDLVEDPVVEAIRPWHCCGSTQSKQSFRSLRTRKKL